MTLGKSSQEKDGGCTDRVLFKKQCKYIGSVAVTLLNGEERQQFVNEKLIEMKDIGKGVPVILMITDEGIKVLTENESGVKMAHGITRIAFSTCQPERKIFAYVAKSLSASKTTIIQAHVFKTKKNSHSQQLSLYLSKAFKISYARDTTRRKNRVKLFETEAAEQKVASEIQTRGKRWAKMEIAHGHENSGHALNARGKYESSDINKLMKELGVCTEEPQVQTQKEMSRKISDSESSSSSSSSQAYSTQLKENVCNEKKQNNNVKYLSEPKYPQKIKNVSSGKSHWSAGGDTINLVENVPSNSNAKVFVKPASKFVDGSNTPDLHCGYHNVVLSKDGYVISGDVPESQYEEINDNIVDLTNAKFRDARSVEEHQVQRLRMDPSRFTMTEEELLKSSEWFQVGFSREIAETVLQNRSIGSFFVRDSSSHPGSYVMSIKLPLHMKNNGVGHFLIERGDNNFFRIKGFTKQFPTLTDLIAHYGTVQEDIPVQLRLTNDNLLFARRLYIDQPDSVNHSGHLDGQDNIVNFDSDDWGECDDPDYENFTSNDQIMKELELIST